MIRLDHRILLSLFILCLIGCSSRTQQTDLATSDSEPIFESAPVDYWKKVQLRDHPRFGKEIVKRSTLRDHLEMTLNHLSKRRSLPKTRTEPSPDLTQMMDGLRALKTISEQPLSKFWESLDENFFLLSPLSQRIDPAFFTGYYTPIYRGSRKPTKNFRYPVYAPPRDLKAMVKSYTREAIDRDKVLAGKGLEICYLSSPLDVLLLQVQGSGTVHLEDGASLGLGFGGHNQQPYKSLGKVLIEENIIEAKNISLDSIRKAYKEKPSLVEKLILRNPRYIFFQESDGKPRGSSGAVVQAFHSIATERFADGSYRFPVHVPTWLTLDVPHQGQRELLVLCQDTGSAIRGDLRVDIYLGHGSDAEKVAGDLKHTGQLSLLWHRNWPIPTSIGNAPVK